MSTTVALPSEEQIRTALTRVQDPEIKRPITELGMLKGVDVEP
ncbi:MAG TPA: iron-sulfur cluster assembly protein, partial [Jiangellaceae bacterium]|nr:iron-sulfur cluster assembly protein [Jiangellaceae bacterium]